MGTNNIRFLIIATGYNCEKYAADCVASVEAQTYKNFDVVYIDDASTDNTFEEVLRNSTMGWYGKNKKNLGTVKSRDTVLNDFEFEDWGQGDFNVIVWLDLDDKLLPNALETLAKVYQDENIWMTYGNYVTDKGEQPFKSVEIPNEIHEANAYRKHPFMFMHLRSYRKELYEKLTNTDKYGDFGWAYQDANMLFCMMEIAGKEHMKGIDEPLYVYTISNPISVMNRFTHKQRQEEYKRICSIKPKERLKEL